MYYRNASQDEVASLVRTGGTKFGSVLVKQRGTTAPVLYLQVYNHAAPTVGTTKPVLVFQVPAGEVGQHQSRRFDVSGSKGGANLATALSIAVTTTPDGAVGPDATDKPEVKIKFEAMLA